MNRPAPSNGSVATVIDPACSVQKHERATATQNCYRPREGQGMGHFLQTHDMAAWPDVLF
jgi:hypothetical protein